MSDRPTIRVGVVDDQDVVREGFALILDSQPDIEVVLQCADGRSFVDAVQEGRQLDVALVDIRMPILDGLAATRVLAGRPGAPSIIVVTTFDDDAYVIDAIAAGAHGFLLKRCSGRDLIGAVRSVAGGDAILSPGVTHAVMAKVRGTDTGRVTGEWLSRYHLTPREHDVLTLIGAGLNNTEIASELYLSVSTVKSHVTNVLTKTGSRDRIQAALLSIRLGLPDQQPAHDPLGDRARRGDEC